jgi:CrcB protein
MDYFWVGIGGFAGANTRYFVASWVAQRFGTTYPLGTFLINLSGSLLIGVILTLLTEHLVADPLWRRLIVIGFLGGYTTFSSYTYEALALIDQGDWRRALLYVLGSNLLGLAACGFGITLARLVWRVWHG